jgi:HSP20 family protein
VFETEKEYKVEVAAAGMKREDFKIHIDNDNDLTITMEKNCNCEKKEGECCDGKESMNKEMCKDDKCEERGRYLRREFSYTRFQQTLVMPDNADTEKIEAKVCDGVLHINIPKKATSKENKTNRTIAIE